MRTKKHFMKSVIALFLSVCITFTMGLSTYAQSNGTEQTATEKTEETPDVTTEKGDAAVMKPETPEVTEPETEVTEPYQTKEAETITDEPDAPADEPQSGLSVQYQAHVQNIGWMDRTADGETAGTTGRGLQMEALKVNLENHTEFTGGITYSAHVSNIGWQKEVADGEMAGTTGQGKHIEALTLSLTEELSNHYDVYYRVHSATYGWLGWAKNGEKAGTAGFGKAVQAVEIRICEKDSADAPEQTDRAFISDTNFGDIIYKGHVSGIGWQNAVADGATAGTTGQGRNLEAFNVALSSDLTEQFSGSVQYQAHVTNIGWQNPAADGANAGTTGRGLSIQAVKLNLTGELADNYDIYYRVHSADFGWFGWTCNGEIAGTYGLNCAAQAIEIRLYPKGSADVPDTSAKSYLSEDNMGSIVYKAHVSSIGWQRAVSDGATAGTTGQAKQIEALKMKLSDEEKQSGIDGSVIYQTHVAGIGWQGEVSDGAMAGTSGQGRAVEAVRIRLSGTAADQYDIYYRTHSSNYGWLGWAKNGETAGTVGSSRPVEAIQVKLVLKGDTENAPLQNSRSYISTELIGDVRYAAHVESIGWQEEKRNGQTAGTTGQDKRMEAISISVDSGDGSITDKYTGGIQYSTHVESYGWMNWVKDGAVAGTVGENKRIEAIKIQLTGELAQYCDVYYRTHVSEYGWLGWAKNGQAAGTTSCGYKMQAIEIKIVPRFANAPGSTSEYYHDTPKVNIIMGLNANWYSSATPYLILVNRSTHKVGIFQGWQGHWNCIQYWDCGDGAANTPTKEGQFATASKGYYFDSGSARCFWYTQFSGNYLFHSVLCYKNGAIMDGRVGLAISHGCVRLEVQNAKWIYDNIPTGTKVVVYH